MKGTPEATDARQHTGAVGLFIFGKRPKPKTGAEILKIAKTTEYYETAKIQRKLGRTGRVDYVPRDPVPDAIEQAFMQGLLVLKFSITGSSRTSRTILGLDPGTHYFWLDFVEVNFEGKHEGKWVGRIVDSSGRVMCLVDGVEVKELIYFHPDPRDRDSAPNISIHDYGADLGVFSGPFGDSTSWYDVDLNWIAKGEGCLHQRVCLPKAS